MIRGFLSLLALAVLVLATTLAVLVLPTTVGCSFNPQVSPVAVSNPVRHFEGCFVSREVPITSDRVTKVALMLEAHGSTTLLSGSMVVETGFPVSRKVYVVEAEVVPPWDPDFGEYFARLNGWSGSSESAEVFTLHRFPVDVEDPEGPSRPLGIVSGFPWPPFPPAGGFLPGLHECTQRFKDLMCDEIDPETGEFVGCTDEQLVDFLLTNPIPVPGQGPLVLEPGCSLISAHWDVTTATEGEVVGLVVTGQNCGNELVEFEVLEWDGDANGNPGSHDDVVTNPDSIALSGGVALGAWVAEFHNDTTPPFGTDTVRIPEYFFIAKFANNPAFRIESPGDASGLLGVNPAP